MLPTLGKVPAALGGLAQMLKLRSSLVSYVQGKATYFDALSSEAAREQRFRQHGQSNETQRDWEAR